MATAWTVSRGPSRSRCRWRSWGCCGTRGAGARPDPGPTAGSQAGVHRGGGGNERQPGVHRQTSCWEASRIGSGNSAKSRLRGLRRLADAGGEGSAAQIHRAEQGTENQRRERSSSFKSRYRELAATVRHFVSGHGNAPGDEGVLAGGGKAVAEEDGGYRPGDGGGGGPSGGSEPGTAISKAAIASMNRDRR